ncbi:glycosyltransferase [Paenarthrobacter sp. TYUT067]|uniref:glycosyltransferase n=1 Tax=Paenarthrobacter sp. TYUT067 TaxID=2926245 RepID=UPI00202DD0D7|nr:glycosyltransferase [Paenarthrobacter sp. TYUT067]MCM0615267.1 glycosyltransferase [Paenarthrobacter sp. TYUT067]
MLSEHGYRPVLVGKKGPWIGAARNAADVIQVTWREGTAADEISSAKTAVLKCLEMLSVLKIRRTVRKASLVISSQPGPTAFFSERSALNWPAVRRYALVHGTTAVEWPFRNHAQTVASLDGLLAATNEAFKAMKSVVVSPPIDLIGNLFSADLFWDESLTEVRDAYDPSGPIVFLGTLTPNKTAPLISLLEAVKETDRRLVVVGDGPDIERLRRLASEGNIANRVDFVGRIDDPRQEIASASVVVTAGRGAIESMSAGRPTIVATSEGTHGLARINALEELESYNFTGRTPASREHSGNFMAQEVRHAWELDRVERAAIAERLSRVGSVKPILRALNG